MELSELLSNQPVQEYVCSNLNFEDALKLQDYIRPTILNCPIRHQIKNFIYIIFPGVNDLTVRTYKQVKKYRNGTYALISAVKKNDLSMAQLLLENIVYLDDDFNALPDTFVDREYLKIKSEALNIAITNNNYSMVKLLLDHGVGPNFILPHNYLPLTLAAKGGNVEIIKLLLDHKAEVNKIAPESYYPTALILAIIANHASVVKLLLDSGADPNLIPRKSRYSPFEFAARTGNVLILKLLIDHGVIFIRDLNIAFSLAAKFGNVEALKMLFELAETRQIPLNLNEALGGVSFEQIGEQPDFLRNESVEIKPKNEEKLIETIKFLLDRGANINFMDGRSILKDAAEYGDIDSVRFLLESGAIIYPDLRGITILNRAAERGDLEIVKLLLDSGANDPRIINPVNYRGQTPLMSAALGNNLEIVKLLIGLGANPRGAIEYASMESPIFDYLVELKKT